MANTRNRNQRILSNDTEHYKELYKRRGLKKIRHYGTPRFRHPTVEQRASINSVGHIWAYGDRFYKLSHKHYGTTKYWWLIAKYNGKPTESHINIGDKIDIPLPLDRAIALLEEQ